MCKGQIWCIAIAPVKFNEIFFKGNNDKKSCKDNKSENLDCIY